MSSATDKMLIMGDIHGAFMWYLTQCRLANVAGMQTVQVGDFGLGFPSNMLESQYFMDDNELYVDNDVLFGNHDNTVMLDDC